MFRQASRNQRSKGLKVKHVVQICLLLAVCFWLLYQVKHSHDKKKAFDESTAKISEHIQNGQEILKFGRKDLNERGAVSSSMIEQHHVDEENEEEDENKHEEAEDEGKEDERRGGGDDEIDERDQEKSIEESEHQEDIEDEGKDEEEVKEKEEKEEEENHGKQENEEEEENKENEEGVENKEIAESEDTEDRKENSQEAREAQYNGDDASSAVVKESVNMEGENMNPGISGNDQRDIPEKDSPEVVSNVNATIDSSFDQNGSNASSILKTTEKNDNPERDAVGDSETAAMVGSSFNQNGTNTSSLLETAEKPAENGTDTKEKAGDIGSSVMGNETITSPILENEVDNVTLSNSTVENEPEDGEIKLQSQANETLSRLPAESGTQVLAENLGNETVHVEHDHHQNMTLGTETTTDVADPERQSVLLEQTETSNSTKGEGQNQIEDKNTPTGTGHGLNGNSTDAIGELESDKNVTSLILDENSDKLLLETTDTNSSSVIQDVKEALTDLGTLPETGMEGHSENVSAE